MHSWILESPEASATALCEALVMAIECSKVKPTRQLAGKPSIPPEEAAAKLFGAAKCAIEAPKTSVFPRFSPCFFASSP